MRLAYILAVAVVATLHSSATAFSTVKDSNAVDSALAEGSRMLRGEYGNDALIADDYAGKKKRGDDALNNDDHDDNDLDGDFEEERDLKDLLKKLNPVRAVKKSTEKAAERAEKVKKVLKDAADYKARMKWARDMVNKD